jgi:hypothetical protein
MIAMKRTRSVLALPLAALLAHCGGGDVPKTAGSASSARLSTRISTPAPVESHQKFKGGSARGAALESLKYHVRSIRICESLETQGSGFNNAQGCIDLYQGDENAFPYKLDDDFSSLADAARRTDSGFVDLLSASSRATLAGSTVLTHQDVRSYHYGMITWSLPIKVKATVALGDGSSLYTHDGRTQAEVIGADNYRAYYTLPATSLAQAPAEEAVVLLPNGGNWFKFQSPLTITAADIDERREFVLDLVFNPDGIVKGFSGEAMGSLSERDATGRTVNAMTVPMLDLAPVPHRASERAIRESYQGTVQLDGSAFDLRMELYSIEGDASGTIYGVDVKSLVTSASTRVPPELSKVSFIETAADGTLSFLSFKRTPILTGFSRVRGDSGSSRIGVACGTHQDRAAAEGGAAIVVDRCPAPVLDVQLALTARTPVEGAVSTAVGGGPDAGVDGGAPDAGAL